MKKIRIKYRTENIFIIYYDTNDELIYISDYSLLQLLTIIVYL